MDSTSVHVQLSISTRQKYLLGVSACHVLSLVVCYALSVKTIPFSLLLSQETLPSWEDRADILSCLRACNYNPDECIGIYLSLEGDGKISFPENFYLLGYYWYDLACYIFSLFFVSLFPRDKFVMPCFSVL